MAKLIRRLTPSLVGALIAFVVAWVPGSASSAQPNATPHANTIQLSMDVLSPTGSTTIHYGVTVVLTVHADLGGNPAPTDPPLLVSFSEAPYGSGGVFCGNVPLGSDLTASCQFNTAILGSISFPFSFPFSPLPIDVYASTPQYGDLYLPATVGVQLDMLKDQTAVLPNAAPSNPTVGTTVTLAATVVNLDVSTAIPQGTVAFFLGPADAGQVLCRADVNQSGVAACASSAMPEGANVVTATFYTIALAGTPFEPSSASFNLTVGPSGEPPPPPVLPDLKVTSVSLTPASPADGQAVKFNATITNLGSVATPSGFGTAFYVDNVEVAWNDPGAPLGPGATITVASNDGPTPGVGTWSATGGAHSLEAFTNDTSSFAETSFANNFLTTSFTVTGPPPTPTPVPPIPIPPPGYDLVGSDGGVFVFPSPGTTGGFYGSLPGLGIHVNNIVGMVATANDQGYFLVGSDGGVFAFGNAPFLGSLPGIGVKPTQPITGIVPTGDDRGYFLVGRDGGVFAFGNAPFLGSLPGIGVHVNDIIGIAATPSGNGYWLVAANGSVYAFGAAKYLGGATGTPSPVSAITGTPDGAGYWIVTRSGGVYAFGDSSYYGSLPALGVTPALPVIGLVNTPDDGGYWLIGTDGGIFAFGDAPFIGSLPGLGVHVGNIVGAVPTQS